MVESNEFSISYSSNTKPYNSTATCSCEDGLEMLLGHATTTDSKNTKLIFTREN